MKVNLSGPDITDREIKEVVKVLESGILSIGPKIEEFEQKVADYVGVKHAVAVNSGTSALHLLVRAHGIKEGDEVITTPFSFVASTNCFLFEGAKPVFVDIDPNTLNMNIDEIESKITEKTKAIVAVDVFGQPINMKAIREIADKHNLVLIEDSCEAIGACFNGIKAGQLADSAVFAFYPNKQITTGEGGIIVTNDDKVADLCRSMRSQGRAITGFWLHHERMGFNFRMSELQAALGSVQMDRLDEILEKRNKVAEMYNEALKDIEEVRIPFIASEVTKMSWFVYVIMVDQKVDRDGVMEYLKKNGVGCRPYFTPIHVQPYMVEMFNYEENDFPVTNDAGKRGIALPFHNHITKAEVDYVTKTLKDAVAANVK